MDLKHIINRTGLNPFAKKDKMQYRLTNVDLLLPIGSVVTLKTSPRKLIIIGRMQQNPSLEKEFDYLALLYPEGWIDPESSYMFNHEDIGQIYFKGYEDPDEFNMKQRLKQYVEQNRPKNPHQ